jgi:hypothetical protein
MDKNKALEQIIRILKDCEGNIEDILNDLYQTAFDEGYESGLESKEE